MVCMVLTASYRSGFLYIIICTFVVVVVALFRSLYFSTWKSGHWSNCKRGMKGQTRFKCRHNCLFSDVQDNTWDNAKTSNKATTTTNHHHQQQQQQQNTPPPYYPLHPLHPKYSAMSMHSDSCAQGLVITFEEHQILTLATTRRINTLQGVSFIILHLLLLIILCLRVVFKRVKEAILLKVCVYMYCSYSLEHFKHFILRLRFW